MDLKKLTDDDLRRALDSINRELKCRQLAAQTTHPSTVIKSLDQYENFGKLNEDVLAFNGSHLLALPLGPRESLNQKRIYLQCLLNQNWETLFSSYENESRDFYVYAHVDPRNKGFACKEINLLPCQGVPIYIGKGTGQRAYDLKRNQGHGKIIRFLLDAGHHEESLVRILFDGVSERKAMEIEAKLIYFFGTIYEKERNGSLYNLDISKRPHFIGVMHPYVTRSTLKKVYKVDFVPFEWMKNPSLAISAHADNPTGEE